MGDSYFYRGDYGTARQQYEHALQTANKAALREQIVISKLNLAKVDVAQGRFQAAAPVLKKLVQDADSMGLKAQSVEASVYLGEALLATNQVDAATRELDTALGRAEKLGLRVEQARAQFLLGSASAQSGKPQEAVSHYRQTVSDTGIDQQRGGRNSSLGARRPERHLPRRRQILPGRRLRADHKKGPGRGRGFSS